MTIKLRESGTISGTGSKRRIQLISEGVGSTGIYPADVLQRDGATAFPAGTQIFFDHLTESDEWERRGQHSVVNLVGVTLTDADFSEGALFAEAKFFPSSSAFIDEVSEYVGLSVEAGGTISEGVIESIRPSPLNALAVVPRAGRDGKILELVESYRESGKISESSNSDKAKEDKPMDEKDIKAIVEGITAGLTPHFTALTEALKPAEPAVVTPDEGKTEGPSATEVAEALVVAFPTSDASRKRVYEALSNDKTLDEAIKDEQALIESITKTLTDEGSEFTIRESAAKNDHDYSVGGWA